PHQGANGAPGDQGGLHRRVPCAASRRSGIHAAGGGSARAARLCVRSRTVSRSREGRRGRAERGRGRRVGSPARHGRPRDGYNHAMKIEHSRRWAIAAIVALVTVAAAAQERDRSKIADQYKWNLHDIYPNDAGWRADKAKLAAE